MAGFFIDRPVFAWVTALAGMIAIPQLPTERYPAIAPPSVSISANGTTPRPPTSGTPKALWATGSRAPA